MRRETVEKKIENVDDIKDEIKKAEIDKKSGFVVSVYTDKIKVGKFSGSDQGLLFGYDQDETQSSGSDDDTVELLLEMRVFDENKEIKIFRPTISDDFQIRIIDDKSSNKDAAGAQEENVSVTVGLDYFDEDQFLDIDTKKKNGENEDGRWVTSTGGGRFFVPIIKDDIKELEEAFLKVRHYIDKYQDSGKAYICDWRCVGFYSDSKKRYKV